MNRIVRRTAGFSFWLLKVAVVLLIMFSVMAFLSELATRMRIRLSQPFRGVAVVALAVTSAIPAARAIDGFKQKVLGTEEFEEAEEETTEAEMVTATDS